MRDYEGKLELTEFDNRSSSLVVLLAHQGLAIEHYLDLSVPIVVTPGEEKKEEATAAASNAASTDAAAAAAAAAAASLGPDCSGTPLEYSPADFQHLPSVAKRRDLKVRQELSLAEVVWPANTTTRRMAEVLSAHLSAAHPSPASWPVYHMAALFWRIRGDANKCIECLRRALHRAPY
eukprot:UC1_evm1s341